MTSSTTLTDTERAPPARQGTQARSPRARTRDECLVAGKALRAAIPRVRHAAWRPPAHRRDPIDVLEDSNRGRLRALVPIRYGRMLRSPFAFLRGSAALMAADLAATPSTGLRVQACGDCHLMNFGLFATPERNLVFDINDFDETLPAPWEWDLKRLAVSFAVAARDSRQSDEDAWEAAVECVRAYREKLRACSKQSPLDVWYERLDIAKIIAEAPDAETRKTRKAFADAARKRTGEYLLPKIARNVGTRPHLLDDPPLIFHPVRERHDDPFREAMVAYRRSLPDSVAVLFGRYRLEDYAVKVVGIGSVGTRCLVGLFCSRDGHSLLLQFKEARPSVLAPYAGKSVYRNQGERVVAGQRLMQSSSDIFLGWTRSRHMRDFFGRQLRDMKFGFPSEKARPGALKRYAVFCGRTLARAHARSGDAATISGYLGRSTVFDQAVGAFAIAYARQTERDYAALVRAVRSGRIKAHRETDL